MAHPFQHTVCYRIFQLGPFGIDEVSHNLEAPVFFIHVEFTYTVSKNPQHQTPRYPLPGITPLCLVCLSVLAMNPQLRASPICIPCLPSPTSISRLIPPSHRQRFRQSFRPREFEVYVQHAAEAAMSSIAHVYASP